MGWYRDGKISVESGSRVVLGIGTDFIASISPGFALLGPDLGVYEVETISTKEALQLVEPYRGPDAVEQTYAIWQTQGQIFTLVQATTELLNTFGAFRAAYLAGELVGEGLALKGVLSDPSQLPPAPAPGDAYLVGTSIYGFVSQAIGWKSQNIAGVVPRGPWDGAVDYSVNSLVEFDGSQYRRLTPGVSAGTPDADGGNWQMFVARGPAGPAVVNLRGPWSAATEYAKNDSVEYAGSQYRRLVAGVSAHVPEGDAAHWELFLGRGLDGLGTVSKVNGISPDGAGNVTLPSDVQEFDNLAAFPVAGVVNRQYTARDSGLLYRWSAVDGIYRQVGGAAGTFPFFLANGARSNIPLTSDNKLPFKLADGTTSNIPLSA